MTTSVINALLIILLPALFLFGERKSKIVRAISPVVLSYAAGMILTNFTPFLIDKKLSSTLSEVAMILAIPLLLFSADILQWLRLAKVTVLSFFFCVISVMFSSAFACWYFSDLAPDAWKISGMLVGVYTGGTPNMSAIGLALEVPDETFVLINAVDVVMSLAYLFFMVTIGQKVLGLFLPSFSRKMHIETEPEGGAKAEPITYGHAGKLALAFSLSLGMAAVSAGIPLLFFGKFPVVVIILSVTTLGIIGSFFKKVRQIPGTYDVGQYLLLMFCCAIGTLANIEEVMSIKPDLLLYCSIILYGSIFLHYLLAAIFRIDTDTVLITSTAGIFGPAFIGLVAKALKNRSIIVSGLSTGLVGYAIGNYLGIGLAYLLMP